MADSTNKRIFLVEDDRNFGTVLKAYLEINGFAVTWVSDGQLALSTFRDNGGEFDLCLLDVMLPNIDGFTIAREIRELDPVLPLIFLTAKNLKEDVMEGYNIGADDYVTKPFDSEILILKINAVLNRHGRKDEVIEEADIYKLGDAEFDSPLRTLNTKLAHYRLSPKESDLLVLLCKNANHVLLRDKALKIIWGETTYFTTRSMDVYITRLRKYLRHIEGVEIVNVHGSGYLLKTMD